MTRPLLRADDLAELDRMLAPTDELLAARYPGDDGSRQPLHTVYVPADRYTPALPREWGEAALDEIERQGGMASVMRELRIPDAHAGAVGAFVGRRLADQPIDDLRLDLEDGYGDRGDEVEDADVRLAAERVVAAVAEGSAPRLVGVRIKGLEARTRGRGIRSLELFLTGLREAGDLPDGLILTLPKVTTSAQVAAMAAVCGRLEERCGLAPGRLRFEVQVETPQLVLGPDGTSPLPRAIAAAGGRLSGLHYGTYDYSASLGIAPAHQSMEHPAADHAKSVMQVAAAETGVRLSDGSTNILPVGDPESVRSAWRLSARLVRRSLERGFFQGWDLHPAQLVPRFAANGLFYREGLAPAAARLRDWARRLDGPVRDEPATARALAAFVARGVACGAITAEEATDAAGIEIATLAVLAHPQTVRRESA
jgi:citrate lyase beta subunit